MIPTAIAAAKNTLFTLLPSSNEPQTLEAER